MWFGLTVTFTPMFIVGLVLVVSKVSLLLKGLTN